jgi:transcriptional antiterminator Rof (Rho-off)
VAKLSNSKGDIMTDKQQIEEIIDEPLTLTLTLDDGKELNCEVLATLEHNDVEYIAVLPENEEEFWIYEYSENEDGTLSINNIDDDAIFDEVGKAFEEMFEAEEDADAMLDDDDDDECDCDCDDDDCDCGCEDKDKE